MSNPPVPFLTRQQFESRVRTELDRIHAEHHGRPVPPEHLCQAAHHVARSYAWADTRTVANLLVDTLGTGWGAIYIDWTYTRSAAA